MCDSHISAFFQVSPCSLLSPINSFPSWDYQGISEDLDPHDPDPRTIRQREMAFPEAYLNSSYHLAFFLLPFFALRACCSPWAHCWWPERELSVISNVVIGNRDEVGRKGREVADLGEAAHSAGKLAGQGGIWGWNLDTTLFLIQFPAAGTKWPRPCLSNPPSPAKWFPSGFVMWELLWRPRPSCLAASCWDAVSNLFSKWIGFQVDSLGNQTPLFVPQTGIARELQAEAEHSVRGQLLIYRGLRWV